MALIQPPPVQPDIFPTRRRSYGLRQTRAALLTPRPTSAARLICTRVERNMLKNLLLNRKVGLEIFWCFRHACSISYLANLEQGLVGRV